MKLKAQNPHPRDENIVFDEKPHIYYINGSSENILSVTTFVHEFFPSFDADAIIDKMMASRNWENSKYFGMSKEQIIESWEDNKNYAARKGTILHKDIELFFNDEKVANESKEFEYFLKFAEEHEHLKPFRTEWEVYDEDLLLAGCIDMCFLDEDGEIVIYDWKRSKDIKEINSFENGLFPISNFPHANYWHYSFQLNIYKAILEKRYGLRVKEMNLLWLHPKNDSYIKLSVGDLSSEVKMLFDERKSYIKNLL